MFDKENRVFILIVILIFGISACTISYYSGQADGYYEGLEDENPIVEKNYITPDPMSEQKVCERVLEGEWIAKVKHLPTLVSASSTDALEGYVCVKDQVLFESK